MSGLKSRRSEQSGTLDPADTRLNGMAVPIQVVFDCADPPVVAQFWADALGYQLQGPPEPTAAWRAWEVEHGVPEERWNDASAIIDPDGRGPRIYFQRVPEPKAVKNRLHLDVNAGGPPGTPPSDRRVRVDEMVERLAASGATLVTASTEYDEYCVTMLDPEGNEFDVQ
jgi:hypothetical protein